MMAVLSAARGSQLEALQEAVKGWTIVDATRRLQQLQETLRTDLGLNVAAKAEKLQQLRQGLREAELADMMGGKEAAKAAIERQVPACAISVSMIMFPTCLPARMHFPRRMACCRFQSCRQHNIAFDYSNCTFETEISTVHDLFIYKT